MSAVFLPFIFYLLCLFSVWSWKDESFGDSCPSANYNVGSYDDTKTNEVGRKKRWAIVCLYSSKKPGKIEKRNELLAKAIQPFSGLHEFSVVFFSEEMFDAEAVKGWETTFSGIATVKTIDTSGNGYDLPERYGYKYMCKFFMLDIFSYLRDHYDYYLRCDTDCFITSLGMDIFKWAEEESIGYGWVIRKMEGHRPTATTLPKWVANYVERCNISPSAVMEYPLSKCFHFYNNFHLGNVKFFFQPEVRKFLLAINATSYMLTHRWGDSDLQAYAVRLFMKSNALRQIPNVEYIHGSHKNRLVSTFGYGERTNVPHRLPLPEWEKQRISANSSSDVRNSIDSDNF